MTTIVHLSQQRKLRENLAILARWMMRKGYSNRQIEFTCNRAARRWRKGA